MAVKSREKCVLRRVRYFFSITLWDSFVLRAGSCALLVLVNEDEGRSLGFGVSGVLVAFACRNGFGRSLMVM